MKFTQLTHSLSALLSFHKRKGLADPYGSRSTVQLACPAELSFSPGGNLYVTNRDSQSLQLFTANGRYVKSIDNEALHNPIGIDITN